MAHSMALSDQIITNTRTRVTRLLLDITQSKHSRSRCATDPSQEQLERSKCPLTNTTATSPAYLLYHRSSSHRLILPLAPLLPLRSNPRPFDTSKYIRPFINTHFRTLNTIYRKSQKARFHGPSHLYEIRQPIISLIGV